MTRFMSEATLLAAAILATVVLVPSPVAEAQLTPDVRNIQPFVMLLVDTSGSMERMGSCVCTTPSCEECYPVCTAARSDRNRWATVLEAMTGRYNTFTCTRQNRSSLAASAYDYNYFIPHFAPPVGSPQLNDGVLDAYIDRIRFGLMTFDGIGTRRTDPALVAAPWGGAYITTSEGPAGMYSYGGPHLFNFPGCLTDYMLDNGARGDSPPGGVGAGMVPGNLISVGSESSNYRNINQRIQDSLAATRPFGPTPLAGMLDDVRYYFDNNPDVRPVPGVGVAGDPYAACRDRYVLLLTDGYPNADMREDPYNCDTPGHTCPYSRPEEIAADLCTMGAGGACSGRVKGVFVVGFNISDPAATTRLNDMAALGGTGAAMFATDRASLMSALASALDRAAPGTTTRTVPAFSSSVATQGQDQFNTGFRIGTSPGEAWSGVLERRRFECVGSTVVEQPVDASDRFQEKLNTQGGRHLFTVVPNDWRDSDKHLIGVDRGLTTFGAGITAQTTGRGGPGGRSPSCGGGPPGPPPGPPGPPGYTGPVERGLTLRSFDNTIAPAYFGVSTSVRRNAIIDWVQAQGAAPPSRVSNRLGDIYHSSPVTVGPPVLDIPDESYTLFRARPEVANRPTVLYVGSNDGVLHAFATQDATCDHGVLSGTSVTAGEELWGFVAPMHFGKLESVMASHQFLMDGTPVVKDIFFQRLPGSIAADDHYHTVLVTGMRGGGGGYIALDVTDPCDPEFLWQFTHPGMGNTYGTPALGQVLVNAGAGGLQERALALLPGGQGDDLTDALCGPPVVGAGGVITMPLGCSPRGVLTRPVTDGSLRARSRIRCWDTKGRSLYFIDPGTGELIEQLDDRVFSSPLTGGAAFFTGDVGTDATRAFMTDDDGVIWRIDFSSPTVSDWDAVPFHDIFADAEATVGQPSYPAPVLSTDLDGHVVILVGTGDVDRLGGTAQNRVVSVSEDYDASGNLVGGIFNWEIILDRGEQITGPLELFSDMAYFGSFASTGGGTDACSFGFSRLWGVHYREADSVSSPGSSVNLPKPGLESVAGSGTLDTRFLGPFDNQIVMGVAITQRPTCFQGAEFTDPYLGSRYRVTSFGGGGFQLVAQVGGGGTVAVGGSVGEITRDLPLPISYTQVQAFAPTIE